MSDINRWQMWADEVGDIMGVTAENANTGETIKISSTWLWISYSDHIKAIEAKDKEIGELKNEISFLKQSRLGRDQEIENLNAHIKQLETKLEKQEQE